VKILGALQSTCKILSLVTEAVLVTVLCVIAVTLPFGMLWTLLFCVTDLLGWPFISFPWFFGGAFTLLVVLVFILRRVKATGDS